MAEPSTCTSQNHENCVKPCNQLPGDPRLGLAVWQQASLSLQPEFDRSVDRIVEQSKIRCSDGSSFPPTNLPINESISVRSTDHLQQQSKDRPNLLQHSTWLMLEESALGQQAACSQRLFNGSMTSETYFPPAVIQGRAPEYFQQQQQKENPIPLMEVQISSRALDVDEEEERRKHLAAVEAARCALAQAKALKNRPKLSNPTLPALQSSSCNEVHASKDKVALPVQHATPSNKRRSRIDVSPVTADGQQHVCNDQPVSKVLRNEKRQIKDIRDLIEVSDKLIPIYNRQAIDNSVVSVGLHARTNGFDNDVEQVQSRVSSSLVRGHKSTTQNSPVKNALVSVSSSKLSQVYSEALNEVQLNGPKDMSESVSKDEAVNLQLCCSTAPRSSSSQTSTEVPWRQTSQTVTNSKNFAHYRTSYVPQFGGIDCGTLGFAPLDLRINPSRDKELVLAQQSEQVIRSLAEPSDRNRNESDGRNIEQDVHVRSRRTFTIKEDVYRSSEVIVIEDDDREICENTESSAASAVDCDSPIVINSPSKDERMLKRSTVSVSRIRRQVCITRSSMNFPSSTIAHDVSGRSEQQSTGYSRNIRSVPHFNRGAHLPPLANAIDQSAFYGNHFHPSGNGNISYQQNQSGFYENHFHPSGHGNISYQQNQSGFYENHFHPSGHGNIGYQQNQGAFYANHFHPSVNGNIGYQQNQGAFYANHFHPSVNGNIGYQQNQGAFYANHFHPSGNGNIGYQQVHNSQPRFNEFVWLSKDPVLYDNTAAAAPVGNDGLARGTSHTIVAPTTASNFNTPMPKSSEIATVTAGTFSSTTFGTTAHTNKGDSNTEPLSTAAASGGQKPVNKSDNTVAACRERIDTAKQTAVHDIALPKSLPKPLPMSLTQRRSRIQIYLHPNAMRSTGPVDGTQMSGAAANVPAPNDSRRRRPAAKPIDRSSSEIKTNALTSLMATYTSSDDETAVTNNADEHSFWQVKSNDGNNSAVATSVLSLISPVRNKSRKPDQRSIYSRDHSESKSRSKPRSGSRSRDRRRVSKSRDQRSKSRSGSQSRDRRRVSKSHDQRRSNPRKTDLQSSSKHFHQREESGSEKRIIKLSHEKFRSDVLFRSTSKQEGSKSPVHGPDRNLTRRRHYRNQAESLTQKRSKSRSPSDPARPVKTSDNRSRFNHDLQLEPLQSHSNEALNNYSNNIRLPDLLRLRTELRKDLLEQPEQQLELNEHAGAKRSQLLESQPSSQIIKSSLSRKRSVSPIGSSDLKRHSRWNQLPVLDSGEMKIKEELQEELQDEYQYLVDELLDTKNESCQFKTSSDVSDVQKKKPGFIGKRLLGHLALLDKKKQSVLSVEIRPKRCVAISFSDIFSRDKDDESEKDVKQELVSCT